MPIASIHTSGHIADIVRDSHKRAAGMVVGQISPSDEHDGRQVMQQHLDEVIADGREQDHVDQTVDMVAKLHIVVPLERSRRRLFYRIERVNHLARAAEHWREPGLVQHDVEAHGRDHREVATSQGNGLMSVCPYRQPVATRTIKSRRKHKSEAKSVRTET